MKKEIKLIYRTKKDGKEVMKHNVLIDEKDLEEFEKMLKTANKIRKKIIVTMEVLENE